MSDLSKLPNRYRDPEGDDGDMDLYMEMSDEELEREEAAAIRELQEIAARMTPRQHYRASRRSCLRTCIGWRNMIRQNFVVDLARQELRNTQLRLAKLRIYHATGQYPGSA